MRLQRIGFIQISNVNKNITVEAKLISPPPYKQQQVKKKTELYSDKKTLHKTRLQLYFRNCTASLAHRSNSHVYHNYRLQYRPSHDIIRSKMATYYDQTTAETEERWKNGTRDTDRSREFCFVQLASIQRQYSQKGST